LAEAPNDPRAKSLLVGIDSQLKGKVETPPNPPR
jgi:hypothetical protein